MILKHPYPVIKIDWKGKSILHFEEMHGILENVKLFWVYLWVILKSNTLTAHFAHFQFLWITYESANRLNMYFCIVNIAQKNNILFIHCISSTLSGQQNKRYSDFSFAMVCFVCDHIKYKRLIIILLNYWITFSLNANVYETGKQIHRHRPCFVEGKKKSAKAAVPFSDRALQQYNANIMKCHIYWGEGKPQHIRCV